jgi:hypothetical protein
MLFVQADEHLRALVAEEVHDAVVQPAEARSRVQQDIRNVHVAQQRGDGIAAPHVGAC